MAAESSFCHKCGSPLPGSATFCPKCGTSVATAAAPQVGTGRRNEKGEKHEKREKHEKGEKNEKQGGSGILGAVAGGLIIIWLGITFYLQDNGYLSPETWWAYFLVGVGAVLVFQGVVLLAEHRRGLGPLIGGAAAVFIGASTIATREYNLTSSLWPLVIVLLGVFVIVAGITARRRVPTP